MDRKPSYCENGVNRTFIRRHRLDFFLEKIGVKDLKFSKNKKDFWI
jgi:hypothetical protein